MAGRARHKGRHPPRKNRKVQYDYDKTIYKQRNVIERMFCRLKDWRRIATRFDRNIKNLMGAIHLVAVMSPDPSVMKLQVPRAKVPMLLFIVSPFCSGNCGFCRRDR
jgi:hypothetical protein